MTKTNRTGDLATATSAQAYRGYLIRFSALTHSNGVNRIWIEKDNHFIGWASSNTDARTIIDQLS